MSEVWDEYAARIPMLAYFDWYIESVLPDPLYRTLLDEWREQGKPDEFGRLGIGTFGITETIANRCGIQLVKMRAGIWFYFSEMERAMEAIAQERSRQLVRFLDNKQAECDVGD